MRAELIGEILVLSIMIIMLSTVIMLSIIIMLCIVIVLDVVIEPGRTQARTARTDCY